MGLPLYALNICVTVVWLGLIVELKAVGVGPVPNTLSGFGILFLIMG